MPGALLRSGKLQEFKPLGEDGQPVYTSALQLREAIRLKLGRDAAHCLAVPQRNETGDRIDWYAPEEGDVVPWSAATDEERVEAKAMLEKMHASLLQVGSTMRTEQNRDRQIFGRLLEKVIYFPDDTHVYLVNGKPVLTFWGFTDPHGGSGEDPLGRLQPRAPAPVEVVAPRVPDPVPVPPPVVVEPVKKRFPWWWLLLIPLLLLLLWLLLRSCAPEVEIPFITPPEVTEEQPLQPGETIRDGVRYDANGNVIGSSNSTSTGDNAGTTDQGTEPGTEPAPDLQGEETPEETPPDAQQPEEQPPVPEEQPPQDEQTPPAEEPKQEEPKPEEQTPPELQPDEQPKPEEQQQPTPPELQQDPSKQQQPPQQPGQKPGQQAPAKPLEIPPDAAKTGNTDFLNGQWKAGSGIQDARTGKPMRLDYDLKDGKGKVKITGANGVECVGDVNAGMSGGGVVINNQGAAKCNDGSTYKLPNVTCKPGATSAADCSGQYENSNKFPMSMKQGG